MIRTLLLALILAGCNEPEAPAFVACDTAADCAAGDVCPVETGICAPPCVDYDDCYGVGDGHCAYLAEGPACVWHCAEDAPEEFTCIELEDEGSVLVSP